MKAVSPEMLALLESSQFFSINLYTIDLAHGAGTLRYCAGDKNITANGILYPATGVFGSSSTVGGPYFDTENNKFLMHQKIGLEVDTLMFDVIPGHAKVNGVPFLIACKNGVFDSAIVTVERAVMPTYGDTTAGTIVAFKGRVGSADAGRSVATFTINSYLELLNIDIPRNVYQAGCINTLGDSTCQVIIASYAVPFVDVGGSTTSVVNGTLITVAAGYFDQGRLTFTSGALIGLTRTVRVGVYSGHSAFFLVGVLPIAPTVADTFTVTPGCDKSVGPNGCPKFSNLARFRGFRFIPNPATAF